jgi:hypothetical protein
MGHYAKVEDSIVVAVIVADQEFVDTQDGAWIQTSYNTRGNKHFGPDGLPDGGVALRGNFAGTGSFYDADRDAFYRRTPDYPSWLLDETSLTWEPPVPRLDDRDGYKQFWSEEALCWVEEEI